MIVVFSEVIVILSLFYSLNIHLFDSLPQYLISLQLEQKLRIWNQQCKTFMYLGIQCTITVMSLCSVETRITLYRIFGPYAGRTR